MKKIIWAFLFLMSCGEQKNVIYSDVPIEYFLDKKWALGDNPLFSEDICFYLESDNRIFYQYWPDEPYTQYAMASWQLEKDYILIIDYDGYDAELRPYGSGGDYTLSATIGGYTRETNLYKCEF